MGGGRLGRWTRVAAPAAVLSCAFAAPAEATFKGGNGLVAAVYYVVDRTSEERAIHLLDRQGKAKKKFEGCTRSSGDEEQPSGPCPVDPAFSPDGRRIAHGLGGRLALQPVGGGSRVVLPKLTQRDGDPYFSPEGDKLVFAGRTAGERNLFTVSTDGTGLQQITRSGGASPAWSSRGEIAFTSGKRIFRLRPGRRPMYVANGRAPDWSPSGNAIVYVSRGSVFRVAARGGAKRRLVRRGAYAAAFSPTGGSFVFGRSADNGGSLFVARSRSGRGSRRLARGGELPIGSTFLTWEDPAWQPLP